MLDPGTSAVPTAESLGDRVTLATALDRYLSMDMDDEELAEGDDVMVVRSLVRRARARDRRGRLGVAIAAVFLVGVGVIGVSGRRTQQPDQVATAGEGAVMESSSPRRSAASDGSVTASTGRTSETSTATDEPGSQGVPATLSTGLAKTTTSVVEGQPSSTKASTPAPDPTGPSVQTTPSPPTPTTWPPRPSSGSCERTASARPPVD